MDPPGCLNSKRFCALSPSVTAFEFVEASMSRSAESLSISHERPFPLTNTVSSMMARVLSYLIFIFMSEG